MADSRSFKVTGEKTIEMKSQKAGKDVGEGSVVVSADGKTRTVTTKGTNAKGEKVTNTLVYDKS